MYDEGTEVTSMRPFLRYPNSMRLTSLLHRADREDPYRQRIQLCSMRIEAVEIRTTWIRLKIISQVDCPVAVNSRVPPVAARGKHQLFSVCKSDVGTRLACDS